MYSPKRIWKTNSIWIDSNDPKEFSLHFRNPIRSTEFFKDLYKKIPEVLSLQLTALGEEDDVDVFGLQGSPLHQQEQEVLRNVPLEEEVGVNGTVRFCLRRCRTAPEPEAATRGASAPEGIGYGAVPRYHIPRRSSDFARVFPPETCASRRRII
ncbi:UNVERIFIED_CONTAM: hypothetical protein PYX00_001510 [Menopon gallinae]|uniref:Uncharacterized protein n=1 Tax=Menopon gallinae TaxID=328185 RepID=A0AAW2IF64_9NEOP